MALVYHTYSGIKAGMGTKHFTQGRKQLLLQATRMTEIPLNIRNKVALQLGECNLSDQNPYIAVS